MTASEWDIIGAEPLPEDAVVLAETLERLLRPLDPRERTIVTMRLQGERDDDIAREVGRSEFTVQTVLRRVNKKLQRMIEQDHIDS